MCRIIHLHRSGDISVNFGRTSSLGLTGIQIGVHISWRGNHSLHPRHIGNGEMGYSLNCSIVDWAIH